MRQIDHFHSATRSIRYSLICLQLKNPLYTLNKIREVAVMKQAVLINQFYRDEDYVPFHSVAVLGNVLTQFIF